MGRRLAKLAITQARFLAEMDTRPYELELQRRCHAQRGDYRNPNGPTCGLIQFIRDLWPVLEPATPFVDGKALWAICEHLEAVTFGDITRLLINVPMGFAKSITTSVFWPAWEWGAMRQPHHRYVCFSYSSTLTERDGRRFRDLITSSEYRDLYGDVFSLRNETIIRVMNDKSGWKYASSSGGVGTGERGTRVIIDDPHNVKDIESDVKRAETSRWFRESISSRFNDMDKDALVIVMQRLHSDDISGIVLGEDFNYTHLMLPWEFDSTRQQDANGENIKNSIGWSDWRTRDGEPAWPERFSDQAIKDLKSALGPYAVAGQLQQAPAPRGGGVLKRQWWKVWAPANNRYPSPLHFKVASLDAAASIKKSADFSALTCWAVFEEPDTKVKSAGVILLDAWAKRLELHAAEDVPRLPQEAIMLGDNPQIRRRKEQLYMRRVGDQMGLVEWLIYTCRRWDVDVLLIENEKAGLAVAQEMRRLCRNENFMVQLVRPVGDKYSRVMSTVPLFADGKIYAPDLNWADKVITECEVFPRGSHDDLVDSTTMALRFLRDNNLIRLQREERAEELDRAFYKPGQHQRWLYPV